MARDPAGTTASGGIVRAMVIRGDLTSLGLAVALGGVAAGVGALLGELPLVPTLVGGAVATLCGAALVRWSRARWRAMLAEVIAAHDADTPGPSPVPWIDDALWRSVNRFDPEIDAAGLLVASIEPGRAAFGTDATGAFTEPVLRPVADEERELATPAAVPDDAPPPRRGDAPTLQAELAGTPGRFIAVGPRWPVCCTGLATMVSHRAADRDPAALFLAPPGAGEEVDRTGRGLHGFQCHACGRRYATDPTW